MSGGSLIEGHALGSTEPTAHRSLSWTSPLEVNVTIATLQTSKWGHGGEGTCLVSPWQRHDQHLDLGPRHGSLSLGYVALGCF